MDLDAVTKANHFRKCAPQTKDIAPNLACSFAGPEAEVRALDAAGKLNLKSFVDTDGAHDGSHDDDIRACTSSLHCARPEAPATVGPCDVHGVVSGVCAHSIPLRGTAVDMHGPEQFVYYLIIIAHLVNTCKALRYVYVDFACRLSVTWQRFVTNHGAQVFPSEAAYNAALGLLLLVNWMHGSSHDMSCQIVNNGRFTEGAGHRHGEGCEQMWSLTKVSGSIFVGQGLAGQGWVDISLL